MLAALLRRRAPRNLRFLSTAYTFSSPGEPSTVLARTPIEPPSAPKGSDVHVSWLAVGVDPVDLATISGAPSANAFNPASLPAVPGNEGVASVKAVGPDVDGISEGDLVIPIKSAMGTWCESGTVAASDVIPIPPMRLELAATLSASPFSSFRMLSDFVRLAPGDVVLQNAAGGPVGTAVVQIAKALGLKTISLVKTPYADYAPTVERLKLLGGDVVIDEKYTKSEAFQSILADMPKPKLVLNGGNQESCAILAGMAHSSASVVTYCPGVCNEATLKQKGLKSEMFSLPAWLSSSSREDVQEMVLTLSDFIQEGKLTAWLQRVKFDELPEALHEGSKTQRKMVAVMDAAA